MSGKGARAKKIRGTGSSPEFKLSAGSHQPLFLKFLVFFAESFDAAGCIYQFLFSGKKRVAF